MSNKIKEKDLKKVSGGAASSKKRPLTHKKEIFCEKNDNNYLFKINDKVKVINSYRSDYCEVSEGTIIERDWEASSHGASTYIDVYACNINGIRTCKFDRTHFVQE